MNSIKLAFSTLILTCAGSSFSQDNNCKEIAEIAVELKEDYKNLNEVYADLRKDLATSQVLEGTETGIELKYSVQRRKIIADAVFTKELSGVKGQKLYKKVFDICNKSAKESEARAARQEAREEKKRAVREAKSSAGPSE
jgi:hypothetical protein